MVKIVAQVVVDGTCYSITTEGVNVIAVVKELKAIIKELKRED